MARSQSGTGDKGEWIELYNASGKALNIGGCVLKDLAKTHTIAGTLSVSSGGYLLLGVSSVASENHGISPDYVYTNIQLNNTGPEMISLECKGITIDDVTYETSWVELGYSSQLSQAKYNAIANNDGANWTPGTSIYGSAGKYGSPGSINTMCP